MQLYQNSYAAAELIDFSAGSAGRFRGVWCSSSCSVRGVAANFASRINNFTLLFGLFDKMSDPRQTHLLISSPGPGLFAVRGETDRAESCLQFNPSPADNSLGRTAAR